ncbi:MAG TPA: M48 family metalloprotease [Candidatus Baltobacteraceae bacterium]
MAIAGLLLAALFVLFAGGNALAGTARPNALDRSVDAIPAATLQSAPAIALVDADREAAAERLQGYRAPIWIAMMLLQILVLAWFWRSGWAAAWRDRLRRSMRNAFAVRFVFGASLVLIAKFAALLPQFAEYRLWRVMDISTELSRAWIADWFLGALFAMAIAGVVAGVVLWFADRTHQWYLYTIAGVIAITLLVKWANPLTAPAFARETAVPPAVATETAALASGAGLGGVRVREAVISDRTRAGSANVIGLGPSQTLLLSDTLLQGSTRGEVRFAIAREIGYLVADDSLHLAIAEALIAIVGAALAVFIADRIGFRRDDDPVSRLALVGALLGCVYLIALPLYRGYERGVEARADRYALALTRDPAPAIRAVVRRADQELLAVCPNRFSLAYFETMPPTAARVAAFTGRANPCP